MLRSLIRIMRVVHFMSLKRSLIGGPAFHDVRIKRSVMNKQGCLNLRNILACGLSTIEGHGSLKISPHAHSQGIGYLAAEAEADDTQLAVGIFTRVQPSGR